MLFKPQLEWPKPELWTFESNKVFDWKAPRISLLQFESSIIQKKKKNSHEMKHVAKTCISILYVYV